MFGTSRVLAAFALKLIGSFGHDLFFDKGWVRIRVRVRVSV